MKFKNLYTLTFITLIALPACAEIPDTTDTTTPTKLSVPAGHPIYVASQGQFNEIIKNNTNVVIDFYADWCGPCRNMNPIIDMLAQEFTNIVFVKVNYDSFKNLGQRYSIRSLPTFIYFKHGNEIARTTGSISKSAMRSKLANIY